MHMSSTKFVVLTIILLLAIVSTGIYAKSTLSKSSEKLVNYITNMESNALAGNWENAKVELAQMQTYWSKAEKTWSILIDHIEIDNIDMTLSKMEKFIDVKDTSMALSEAAALKQNIQHIPDKESLNLENIL
jgi:hypothetical protein